MIGVERIIGVINLWNIAVAGVKPPSNDRLQFWCQKYSDAEIEHAFVRVSRKLHRGDVLKTTPDVERYVSGVLFHEAQKRPTAEAA
jgi:hypothetical protein